jgi:putative oxidoreductase
MPVRVGTAQTSGLDEFILLLGRILLGWLFVFDGFWKIVDLGPFSAGLARDGVPFLPITAPVAVAVEFLGGLAVLIGFQLRYTTLIMALFVVVASLIRHRYWEFPDPGARAAQVFNFYRNVSIIGGLLILRVAGPGRLSVDVLLRSVRKTNAKNP